MGYSTRTILAVDNDPFILEVVAKFLVSKGCRVISTTDPENVFAMAIAEKPHLILTDIAMPGIDGLSLIKNLKEDPATQNIPSGAAAYLSKPVDWERDWPKLQAILWLG